ncbi:hypothetical protein [Luedemannella helvata]|uniref:Uncharacterized protein n=1 Tax=Luedemannella helvata TaxID=349315 RepID=A0ABN2L9H3_9ACTN
MSQESSAAQPPVALAFERDEWELLVTLPRRVVIAATSAELDPPDRTVAEGLAGLEAIAAGRSSPSRLVREVVASIYAADDRAEPSAEAFLDPEAGIAQTMNACRHANDLLKRKARYVDAAGYRAWLAEVAAAVCGAARTGGVSWLSSVTVTLAEGRFLDELAAALAD